MAGDGGWGAEARTSKMGACVERVWGWMGLCREEGRPPGTQCSQETAVPMIKTGSLPRRNFLNLNCRALVRADHVGASPEAHPDSTCADEHLEVRDRG